MSHSESSAPFKNPRALHGYRGRSCSVLSVGSYVPSRVLTNAALEKMVSTSDEWITTRTGIKERRIASDDELRPRDRANLVQSMALLKEEITYSLKKTPAQVDTP